MRESQSLDRITEAQEYEMRNRCYAESEAAASNQHIDHRYSLLNLNTTSTFSVAETKEEYEYDEEADDATDQIMNTLNAAKATLQQEQYLNNNTNLSRNFNQNHNHNHNNHHSHIHISQKANSKKSNETPKDIYNLNSIEQIDLILEDKSLTKAIHVTTGSKCFVTMKKIRRLGKYFPVMNFS